MTIQSERTSNGNGKVNNLAFSQIKKFKLKDNDDRLTEHIVSKFEEALLVIKGKIMVNLEMLAPTRSSLMPKKMKKLLFKNTLL